MTGIKAVCTYHVIVASKSDTQARPELSSLRFCSILVAWTCRDRNEVEVAVVADVQCNQTSNCTSWIVLPP